jgi:hypothetical protein
VATRAEAAAHRAVITDIETLAVADMVDAWDMPDDPQAATPKIRRLIDDTVDAYHPASASVSADWYEELRAKSKVRGRYVAALADRPPAAMIQQTAEWVAAGLYVDDAKALSDATAAVQRMIALGDRNTIALNVRRDPARARWARYASATACAFCAMLATRGGVYRSEDTAGAAYHKSCACVAVPIWTPADYDEAPYVADWRESYYAARDEVGGSQKAILSHMREHAGLR